MAEALDEKIAAGPASLQGVGTKPHMYVERDIIWQGRTHAVVHDKKAGLHEVLRMEATHMTTNEAYPDPSVAVARAQYLDKVDARFPLLQPPTA